MAGDVIGRWRAAQAALCRRLVLDDSELGFVTPWDEERAYSVVEGDDDDAGGDAARMHSIRARLKQCRLIGSNIPHWFTATGADTPSRELLERMQSSVGDGDDVGDGVVQRDEHAECVADGAAHAHAPDGDNAPRLVDAAFYAESEPVSAADYERAAEHMHSTDLAGWTGCADEGTSSSSSSSSSSSGVVAAHAPTRARARVSRVLEYVGGVDISFVKGSRHAIAALVVLAFPDLKRVVYEDYERVELTLPYVSGFLAFREAPHLMRLLGRLRERHPELLPQVLFVDGNGILHPRACGLASHLGALTGIPCLGVGKTLMAVDGIDAAAVHAAVHGRLRDRSDIVELAGASPNAVWGAAVRMSPANVKSFAPLYVSVGHRMSLRTAVALVLLCASYRVPEPVRQADLRSRDKVRLWLQELQPPAQAAATAVAAVAAAPAASSRVQPDAIA